MPPGTPPVRVSGSMHALQGSNADRLLPANVLNSHLWPVGNASRKGKNDMIKSLQDYRSYRRTLRDLRRMSDQQLEDIGVPRWRVRAVARGAQVDPRLVV